MHIPPSVSLVRALALALLPLSSFFAAVAARANSESCPLGLLDARAYLLDADSLRVSTVKSGGLMDDSGIRVRDEIIGVQTGGKFAPFTRNARENMQFFGSALDQACGTGNVFKMKVRVGRDEGFANATLPKMGAFVPGYAITKMTVEGKENKNEFFFKGSVGWLAKHQGADGRIAVGEQPWLATALAGFAFMSSPNPEHEKNAAKVAAYFEAVLKQEVKIDVPPAGLDVFEKMGGSFAGPHMYGWALLYLSEYNWRHPSYDRAKLLQKGCDEFAEYLFNPSYKYKDPSKTKADKFIEDPENPTKTYYKGRLDVSKVYGSEHTAIGLPMALWCYQHCVATSPTVTPNADALRGMLAQAQAMTMPANAKGVRAFPRAKDGSYALPISRHDAACLAQALAKSNNSAQAQIGQACTAFLAKAPLHGDESEAGVVTVGPTLARFSADAYRHRFPEWRWYLSLMMRGDGTADVMPFKARAYVYGSDQRYGARFTSDENANAIAAFLLAAPNKKLLMTGAVKPVQDLNYNIGDAAAANALNAAEEKKKAEERK